MIKQTSLAKGFAKAIFVLVIICFSAVCASDIFAQIPPPPPPSGGGGGGGGPAGAPIDGGAVMFLAAGAAYGYKKLKGKVGF